jgi:cytochrome c oxidase subunit 2
MRRDFVLAGLLWIVLTALGEWVVLNVSIYPIQAAEEAVIIDDAFQLLLILATPVFTFVVTALLYSVLRFRTKGEPTQDGPPIQSSVYFTIPWLVITGGLAILVIFNPGLSGINELSSDKNAELVIEVTAEKWQWDYVYPQYGISIVDADTLVLPVDRRVRFEITSRDIIHSFWIPAFRMKADAVPGRITEFLVTPTLAGSFADDFNMRVQCAELCGTGHPRMRTRLDVLELTEFEVWVAENGGSG